jgi:hypothetical protein
VMIRTDVASNVASDPSHHLLERSPRQIGRHDRVSGERPPPAITFAGE